MTADWSALARHLRVAGLALLAGWVTVLGWRVLTVDFGEVSVPLLFIGALVAGLGAVGRWRRVSAGFLVPLQLALAALLVMATVTGSPLPTPSNVDAFTTALGDAVTSSRAFAAPVPANAPPVQPLLLVAGAMVVVLMDVVAGTLRRASVSGLVLLAAYTLPVTVTGEGVSWWLFVVVAALFLGLVFVQHADQLAAWGRSAADDASGFSVRTGAVNTTAVALGASAIGLALVVPLAVPTMRVALFDGAGPGSREVEVKNPMADLRRDLTRGRDIPLLWVTTDGPRPDYLRMTVLTRFVDGRWTPGDRDIPESQGATGELPPLDGVSVAVPRAEDRYRVRISPDLDSTWLPTLAQVTRINAGPDWRYDTTTRDFIAADEDVTTARRSYDFTGVTLDYDATSMNTAVSGAGSVRSIYTEVSPSLPNEVRRLAATVTADAPTRYQKAQALQEWFRVDGGFRYDVNQAKSLGNDTADLLAFLDEDTGRVGYCEQFAAAMGIMARTLGIPTRLAVGFLQPDRSTNGSWEFSAHDLHVWPELYFPGSGWVRFEPTPADRARDVPGYTTAEFEAPSETASPSATRSSELLPDRGRTPGAQDTASQDDGSSIPWAPVLLSLLGVLVVAALLLTPRLVRRRRRERRLAGGVEGLWAELRATTLDLGHSWPHGRSPRRTGDWLGRLLAARDTSDRRADRPRRGRDQAPEASEALDRLVAALERSRYARSAGEAPGRLQQDAGLVEEALRAGVSPRAERRAAWWPRSVVGTPRLRRTRNRKDATGTREVAPDRVDELVG